ncbi:MAG: ATP-binding protein [Nitrosopumilus sp.]
MQKGIIIAEPTKTLFIDVLTQDVELLDCVLDLIDNSIDSYTRNDYTEPRQISLKIDKHGFEIFDTCGGISLDTLVNDAFKFGVDEVKRDKPTLGLYGIGMKRALFKMGKEIYLETDNGETHSILNLDINTWQTSKQWEMEFEHEASSLNGDLPYTNIKVNSLYPETIEFFDLVKFVNDLNTKVEITYSKFITKGIEIDVNDKSLVPFPLEVRYDDNYKPARHIEVYNDVNIDIICGITPGTKKRTEYEVGRRGWNVFCNDRLILVDDQSERTGWTGKNGMLPKRHQIFNEFFGFVFISSNNPAKLPLNTSKTGLHTSSPIYYYILDKMISTAKPVTKYLAKKYSTPKSESDAIEDDIQSTAQEKSDSTNVSVSDLATDTKFVAPVREANPLSTITYKKPKSLVEKVKKHIGVKNNKAVGSETFDYYTILEGIE